MMIALSDKQENIVGKGENAGYRHFLLFLQCFQKDSFVGPRKPGIVWERVLKRLFCQHFTALARLLNVYNVAPLPLQSSHSFETPREPNKLNGHFQSIKRP